jgi:hypothetical protein
MQASLGLQVPVIETLQEHEGDEEGENEVEDRCGLVFEAVIERPISNQTMEQIIFDLPASMSDVAEQACGESSHGKGRHPPPMMDLCLFDPLVVLTMPFGHRLFGMENPQGGLNAFSRCKTFRIPGPNLASSFFPTLRFHQREDALGILKEHPVLSLQDSNDVFSML